MQEINILIFMTIHQNVFLKIRLKGQGYQLFLESSNLMRKSNPIAHNNNINCKKDSLNQAVSPAEMKTENQQLMTSSFSWILILSNLFSR